MYMRTEREAADALAERAASAEHRAHLAAAKAIGLQEEALQNLLTDAAAKRDRREDWQRLTEAIGGEDAALLAGQLTAVEVARRKLGEVEALPVDSEVRALLYDEFHFTAAPKKRHRNVLRPGSAAFKSLAQMLLFQRFPAGQLHFHRSGYPRSWLLRTPARDLPGLLRCIGQMGGFSPVFATHLTTRWTKPFVMLPAEDARACRRIARTMALQPDVKGLMSSSWLNDPALQEIDPHLAWRFDKLRYGACLATAGFAPPNSGASSHNEARAKLIESGAWRPKTGVLIWPRRHFLAWGTA